MRTGLLFLLVWVVATAGCIGAGSTARPEFDVLLRQYRQHLQTGQAAIRQGNYEQAVQSFSAALEQSPFTASSYHYRGLARFKLGRVPAASDDFRRAIQLEPRSFASYVYRGLCHERLGDDRGAVADYLSAIRIDPGDPGVYNNLAVVYAETENQEIKNPEMALQYALKAADLSKEKNAEILETLSRVYYLSGQHDEAAEALQKALVRDPDNEHYKEQLSALMDTL